MYCEKCGKYSGRYKLCKECYSKIDDITFEDEFEDEIEDENVCEICGEESGSYPLCKICYRKVKEYCEEHFEDFIDMDEEDDEDYETYSTGICIKCHKPKEHSDYFFCSECYNKYKNKRLILQIDNCKHTQELDSFYPGRYICADGHVVKSKAERDIDNFLFKNRIAHCYEMPLSIDGNADHDLHPDFYLPDLQIYIEHWGLEDDEDYKNARDYKIDLYRKLKITLICTHESTDSIDMESALRRKLKHYKIAEINYL